jgi:hypothetical protein
MVDGGKEKGTARTVFHAAVFLFFLVRWISGLSLPQQRISRLPGVNRNCQLASMHDCICSPSQLARAPSCTKYILGEEKACKLGMRIELRLGDQGGILIIVIESRIGLERRGGHGNFIYAYPLQLSEEDRVCQLCGSSS